MAKSLDMMTGAETATKAYARVSRDFVADALREVVPDIGQIDHASKLALGRAVRAGHISKWRGYWFPHAGAPFGMGPLKTCYGPNALCAYFAEWRALIDSQKVG